MAEQPSRLLIEATCDPDSGRPLCALTWGPIATLLELDVVRRTARELFAAAAGCLADEAMVAEFGELGLPDEGLALLLRQVRQRRGQATMGSAAGGVVGVRIRTRVGARTGRGMVEIQRGSMSGELSPDGAWDLGLVWLDVAEAAERDAITRYVLGETGRFSEDEVDGFFARMKQLRKP